MALFYSRTLVPFYSRFSKHRSDSEFCRIENIDETSWLFKFEDLPAGQADWDYNDAIILVELLQDEPETAGEPGIFKIGEGYVNIP